jgi:hypothetical protein
MRTTDGKAVDPSLEAKGGGSCSKQVTVQVPSPLVASLRSHLVKWYGAPLRGVAEKDVVKKDVVKKETPKPRPTYEQFLSTGDSFSG